MRRAGFGTSRRLVLERTFSLSSRGVFVIIQCKPLFYKEKKVLSFSYDKRDNSLVSEVAGFRKEFKK